MNSLQGDIDIKEALRPFCRNTLDPLAEGQQPEIDCILLQKHLEQLHDLQRRTCQEIVDMVDSNLEIFYDVSGQLTKIQQKLKEAQRMQSSMVHQVDTLKKQAHETQSQLQKYLETYELAELETSLLEQAEQAISMLINCNKQLEDLSFGSKLTIKAKNSMLKLSYRLAAIRQLLSHQLIAKHIRHLQPQTLLDEVEQLLLNQLKRQLISGITHKKTLKELQESVGNCYRLLNRHQLYYQTIEEHLVEGQLNTTEANILSNKQAVLQNQDQNRLETFYKSIFKLVSQLPPDYPKDRTIRIVSNFLNRKQLNFLTIYTYAVFPNSFTAYISQVKQLQDAEIREELLRNHKWNIKMWVDVRMKEFTKPSRQYSQDLLALVDSIFKKNCMIEGVKSKFVKVALIVIGRYVNHFRNTKESEEEYANTLNKIVQYEQQVPERVKMHIQECFDNSSNTAAKLQKQCQEKWKACIREYLDNHLKLIVTTCCSSLNSLNTILSDVVTNGKTSGLHKKQSLFKPLQGLLNSNPQLTENAKNRITTYVLTEILKKYTALKVQAMEYSQRTLTVEQSRKVQQAFNNDQKHIFGDM